MRRVKISKLAEPYQSLFEAVQWDCGADAISELVRKGADLRYQHPNTGNTALYSATIANRIKVVEALLQNGADPNQKFTYRSPVDGRVEAGRVALHYATSIEAAAALIKAGAEVNSADEAGTTPLMCAAFRGPPAVVKALLAAGASPLSRQHKRRGRKACTAMELAKSKAEFWRNAVNDSNRAAADQRAVCYEEICDILAKAEREITSSATSQPAE